MQKIWSKDYEAGDYWVRTDVQLLVSRPFQVVLEAIAGGGSAGDIAIDDTSFTPSCTLADVELVSVTTPLPSTTPNPCIANNQFMCLENGQCIDQDKVCDFKVDCPTPGGSDEAECGTCTFDENNNGSLCGWKDHSYGSLVWSLTTGSTDLGPNGDHTNGSGFYVAVQKDTVYNFASMRTPTIGPTGFGCQMKFWYYLDIPSTPSISHISVYIRKQADNFTLFTFLSRVDEPTGTQWKEAVVNIGHRGERFSIGIDIDFFQRNKMRDLFILEIDGTPSATNAIGIDDMEFSNCQAVAPPELEYEEFLSKL